LRSDEEDGAMIELFDAEIFNTIIFLSAIACSHDERVYVDDPP
jgi:hypothetical protein